MLSLPQEKSTLKKRGTTQYRDTVSTYSGTHLTQQDEPHAHLKKRSLSGKIATLYEDIPRYSIVSELSPSTLLNVQRRETASQQGYGVAQAKIAKQTTHT